MEINSSTWETVSNDATANLRTERLRMYGGWLVHVTDDTNTLVSMVFLSDPTHEWEISTSS